MGAARVEFVHVKTDDVVTAGTPLVTLSSDSLKFELAQSQQRLSLLTAQLNRQASNLDDRRLRSTRLEEITAERLTLQSIEDELAQLVIYAPHDGRVSELPTELHRGRYIRADQRLMRLVAPQSQELLALPREEDAVRLSLKSTFTFISDDATAPKVKGRLTALSPTSEAIISETILTSMAGGGVAVHEDKDGTLIANTPVFKVRGTPDTADALARAERGIVKIKASPQSPAKALWRSVMRVLIRETDF